MGEGMDPFSARNGWQILLPAVFWVGGPRRFLYLKECGRRTCGGRYRKFRLCDSEESVCRCLDGWFLTIKYRHLPNAFVADCLHKKLLLQAIYATKFFELRYPRCCTAADSQDHSLQAGWPQPQAISVSLSPAALQNGLQYFSPDGTRQAQPG